MSVTVGTETYGRVKAIGGTPIVTKFAMFQRMPIYPLQSFYSTGNAITETSGVPFFTSLQTVAIHGIPLARIDRLSVAMAYARGVMGALVFFGFLSIIPMIMYFSGERLDDFALVVTRSLIGCFVVGVTGGTLTYLVPLTSRRERRIRRYCGELVGICVDPARVSAETARVINAYVSRLLSQQRSDTPRFELVQQLISCRSKIADGVDVTTMERQTDELVDRIEQIARGTLCER